MANVDFFCCNSGEIVFYLPIHKHLKDGKMVVLKSRYDHERTENFLDKLGIPYQKKPSKNVSLVITTQTKSEPWTSKYWRDVSKVRLMYSLCEKNKMHQKRFCEPFSLVLTPGPFSHNMISKFTNSIIVGYPKYDDFFRGSLKKENILKELGLNLDKSKKTILYAPTSDQEKRSSIPVFHNAIKGLTDEFNVIFKPHIYTDFNEAYLIEVFRASDVIVVDALTLLDKLFVICDLVIGDAQSGIPWEGVLTNKPTIACIRTSDIAPELLESEICNENVVPTVEDPDNLRKTVEDILSHPAIWEEKRLIWADKVCSYRDGTAGKRVAKAILEFAESSRKLSRMEKRTYLEIVQPKKPMPKLTDTLRIFKAFLAKVNPPCHLRIKTKRTVAREKISLESEDVRKHL